MRLRHLALAALAALIPIAANAAPTYSPGQQGTAGNVVACVDASGTSIRCVLPQVTSAPPVLTPLGYQQITSLSAAAALTVPAGATVAYIIPEGQAVRCRDDGTNPTATVGQPLAVGAQLVYSASLSALKCIEQAASAKLNISYYQ